jgi:hypothetical protein
MRENQATPSRAGSSRGIAVTSQSSNDLEEADEIKDEMDGTNGIHGKDKNAHKILVR